MNRTIVLIAVVLATTVSAAQDSKGTLRDVVRRQAPAPVLQTRQRELYPEPLEKMIPQADVVIHGVVTTAQSYLSSDERDVFTDYTVTPIRVLYQRPSQAGRPVALKTVTVKRWGGKVTIDGVPVTLQDLDLPQFQDGDELFLVLLLDKADGKYRLPSPVSGAFRAQNGKIQPLVSHPTYEGLRGLSIDELQSLTNRLHR